MSKRTVRAQQGLYACPTHHVRLNWLMELDDGRAYVQCLMCAEADPGSCWPGIYELYHELFDELDKEIDRV